MNFSSSGAACESMQLCSTPVLERKQVNVLWGEMWQ